MSLGRKLANYRKLAGFTQQQLGEALNLSPQAISKWENDLAEPDLATLRALSELYKIPIGEIIDLNIGVSEPPVAEPEADSQADKDENNKEEKAEIVGFCKNCGVTVTEETVAEKEPVILCKRCRDKREEDARRARLKEETEKREKLENSKNEHVKKLRISLIVAALVTVVLLAASIYTLVNKKEYALISSLIPGTYVIFSYIACLFYDSKVSELSMGWSSKAFHWPGLIFEFSFDGIMRLIGMKLLFKFLGFILAFILTLFCILFALICAPFEFPFVMLSMGKSIVTGTKSKYMW